MTNAGERQVPLPETDSRAQLSVCVYRRRARLVHRVVERVLKKRLDDIRVNDYIPCMVGKVQAEIKQKKPFRLREEEAFVNLLRTADVLLHGVAETLKPFGLSPTQYNVLRILRGAEPKGLACREISQRMITRDPDVTRLLDRLEDRGLAERTRSREDRRVIRTRITDAGLRILETLDAPIGDLHTRQLGHLKSAPLRALIELLEQARNIPR